MTAVLHRPAAPARLARPGPVLAVLLLGQFMAILDSDAAHQLSYGQ